MEDYLFYELEQYYNAGENGLEWNYVRDNLRNSAKYKSLWVNKTKEESALSINNLIERKLYFTTAGQNVSTLPKEIYTITEAGRIVYIDEKKKRENIIKEFQADKIKKWYDTENAKNQFEDYPETKSRAIWSIRLSWIAIGLTVLTLLQQLMCNKPH